MAAALPSATPTTLLLLLHGAHPPKPTPSQASDRPLRIGAADTFARVEVGASLRAEKLSPRAELTAVERALRPSKHAISAASAELDVLPPSDAEVVASGEGAQGTQLHQMVLTYDFEVAPADKDETVAVMPRVQSLHDQIYDSPLDSMLWRLDSADRSGGGGGAVLAYGGAMHDTSSVKLRKGKYTLSLLLRHPLPSQLEALKDLPMMLRLDLPKAAECKVFSSRGAASSAGHGDGIKPMGDVWLRRGAHRNLYVATPTASLPAWVAPGDALVGSLSVDKGAKAVTKLPLYYEAPPHPKKESGDKEEGGGDKKEEEDEGATEAEKAAKAMEEDEKELGKAILEAKLARLKALRTSKASAERYDALCEPLMAEHRSHLPLLLERLAWARRGQKAAGKGADEEKDDDSAEEGKDAQAEAKLKAEAAAEISAAAEAVLSSAGGPIDPSLLAAYFGVAADEEDKSSAAKERKKDMEEQRKALRLALFAKAAAFAPGEGELAESAPDEEARPSAFVAAVREMRAWVTKPEDLEEGERDAYAITCAKYELAHSRSAGALSVLHARHKAHPSKAIAAEVASLYQLLGWEHWAQHAAERIEKEYPKAKTLL